VNIPKPLANLLVSDGMPFGVLLGITAEAFTRKAPACLRADVPTTGKITGSVAAGELPVKLAATLTDGRLAKIGAQFDVSGQRASRELFNQIAKLLDRPLGARDTSRSKSAVSWQFRANDLDCIVQLKAAPRAKGVHIEITQALKRGQKLANARDAATLPAALIELLVPNGVPLGHAIGTRVPAATLETCKAAYSGGPLWGHEQHAIDDEREWSVSYMVEAGAITQVEGEIDFEDSRDAVAAFTEIADVLDAALAQQAKRRHVKSEHTAAWKFESGGAPCSLVLTKSIVGDLDSFDRVKLVAALVED
jgi:hypothetical protein